MKLLQATGTVWIMDWRTVPVEVPAVKLTETEYLIYEEREWKQRYYTSVHPTREAAIEAKLREAETRLASAKSDVERLRKLLTKS